jgi:hypothetical protein
MSTTTGTTYKDTLEAELKTLGLDEDASSHAAWLIASLEEVQYGFTVPRPEKLREIAEAFIEANDIWSMTDAHPAGTLIFEWGEGREPQYLAEAAAVLKKIGVTTRINGQWLNVEITSDYYGAPASNVDEFWTEPEEEEDEDF